MRAGSPRAEGSSEGLGGQDAQGARSPRCVCVCVDIGVKVLKGGVGPVRARQATRVCRDCPGVHDAELAADRHDAHKDPASSAASRWTLANMYSKPPDGVQEKAGGSTLG